MDEFTLIRKLEGHHNDVVSCEFSPDGALLVTASYDTRVIVWDHHKATVLLELGWGNTHNTGLILLLTCEASVLYQCNNDYYVTVFFTGYWLVCVCPSAATCSPLRLPFLPEVQTTAGFALWASVPTDDTSPASQMTGEAPQLSDIREVTLMKLRLWLVMWLETVSTFHIRSVTEINSGTKPERRGLWT